MLVVHALGWWRYPDTFDPPSASSGTTAYRPSLSSVRQRNRRKERRSLRHRKEKGDLFWFLLTCHMCGVFVQQSSQRNSKGHCDCGAWRWHEGRWEIQEDDEWLEAGGAAKRGTLSHLHVCKGYFFPPIEIDPQFKPTFRPVQRCNLPTVFE